MSGNFPFRVNHPPARETSPELDPGNDIHIVYPSTPADLTLKRKSQAGEGAALMHRACTSQCNSEAGVRPYKTRRLNSSPESTPNSTKTKGRVGASLPKTRRSKVAAPTDGTPDFYGFPTFAEQLPLRCALARSTPLAHGSPPSDQECPFRPCCVKQFYYQAANLDQRKNDYTHCYWMHLIFATIFGSCRASVNSFQ